MKEQEFILTDSMSLKTISQAIRNVDLKYERISDPQGIKNFIVSNKENIISKIKRPSYAYGLQKITGFYFPTTKDTKDSIIDIPYGGAVINVGISNSTQHDQNITENWDKGFFDLELRIVYVGENPQAQG